MTKGVVIFGINNERVEYVRLAMMAAAFVKKNMPGIPICLITDKYSVEQFCYDENKYTDELTKWFDSIVQIEPDNESNTRAYRDTRYYSFNENFKNRSRSSVYELSPFDETLLIDCDYLVCNDVLNAVWETDEDIMINKKAIGLLHNELNEEEIRLNPYGIKMYWATVLYFRKSEKAKLLFDLVEHIKENWDFYRLTYEFPGTLFRNDYAFSIAIHVLNGFVEEDFVSDLPEPHILTALDYDQFYGITDHKTLHFFANDMVQNWKFYPSKTVGLNVHCMNKLSLINNMKEIMEVLSE
jgi:hypothetical protein